MNRQEIKRQIARDANEFKSGLVLANRFNGLDLYVGGHDAYMELGSPAACVTQMDKPFIFLADSKILSKYRLTKNEVKAILYHEQGHYELGHTDMDNIIDADKLDNDAYEKHEFDADAKAVEIAVRYGANVDDALVNIAMALTKSASCILEESLSMEQLPSERCIDFLDRRVEALVSRLSDKEAYTQKINKFKKHSFKALLKIARQHGFDGIDDMANTIEENYKAEEEDFFSNFNIADADLDQATLDGLESILLDSLSGMDTDMDKILDDIWNN